MRAFRSGISQFLRNRKLERKRGCGIGREYYIFEDRDFELDDRTQTTAVESGVQSWTASYPKGMHTRRRENRRDCRANTKGGTIRKKKAASFPTSRILPESWTRNRKKGNFNRAETDPIIASWTPCALRHDTYVQFMTGTPSNSTPFDRT